VIVSFIDYYKKISINVEFLNKINEGSNSYIYDATILGKKEVIVAKCSKNSYNYVSFNLQRISFDKCYEILKKDDIVIPQILGYGKDKNIGDILLMTKIENIYPIDFIINNSLYDGKIIIKKIAHAIAILHILNISGYDIEFYWKIDTNQLVILDLGPDFTFNCTTFEMIKNHLKEESNNKMGLWNIVSQIFPIDKAKRYFENNNVIKLNEKLIMEYLDPNSIIQHEKNVAIINGLNIFMTINNNRDIYLKLFIEEYYEKLGNFRTINNIRYIENLSDVITNKKKQGKAKLYYSLHDVLSTESCEVFID